MKMSFDEEVTDGYSVKNIKNNWWWSLQLTWESADREALGITPLVWSYPN